MSVQVFSLVCLSVFMLSWSLGQASDADNCYKGGNFYQIYPRSFKDSNNDGIEDLNGINSKLEYLKEIGVDGVWFSPIFKSPMVDFGYNISDFRAVQPEYGTMEDFDRLAQSCKELGIRLILDFVPNHTSDQHEWFIKSVNKEPGFEDYYIWHPVRINNETGERLPPSNWLSFFRYSAWEWNEKRQQYYLHKFAIQQPDLNYRDPAVVKEMKDILVYWLGKGASGFRVDAVPTIFEVTPHENGNLIDEPVSGECADDPDDTCYLKHIYTQDLNETYDMIYQFRETLEDFRNEHGGDVRILMTEATTSLENIYRYFGDGVRSGSHIPFNFNFMNSINQDSKGGDYQKFIDTFFFIDTSLSFSWEIMIKSDYNILLKTSPGIAITYNGEEIGMEDVIISWEDSVDPPACNSNETTYYKVTRDPARTPFQWDYSKNAGFNEGHKPWLPSTNYKCINVKTERAEPRSYFNNYKRLVELYKEASLGDASYESAIFGDIYTYKRQSGSLKPIVVILNLGKSWQTINLSDKFGLPEQLKVVVASVESQYVEGQIINGTRLTVPNNIVLVLTTV